MASVDTSLARDSTEERLERVLAAEYGLSKFSLSMARSWLAKMQLQAAKGDDDKLFRVRSLLLNLVNRRRRPADTPKGQKRCPEIVPLLTPSPVWRIEDSTQLSWILDLERNWEAIRDEALALRVPDSDGAGSSAACFQPYRAPKWATDASLDTKSSHSDTECTPPASDAKLVDASAKADSAHIGGAWNVCYLDLHGILDCSEALARCPATASILRSIPRAYGHAMFSALAPGTHITPHNGPTNKKIRIQLPLRVPATESPSLAAEAATESPAAATDAGVDGCCRLRVDDAICVHQEGKAIIFDDSFEHEAWNDHVTQARLVLIVDIWHPDLSDAEIKFLSFLRASQMRMVKALSDTAGGTVSGGDDFVAVLSDAGKGTVDAQEVFA